MNAAKASISGIALVFLTSSLPVSVPAITIRVPEDEPSIQQAIQASFDGDVVLVSPGIIPETQRGSHLSPALPFGPELCR